MRKRYLHNWNNSFNIKDKISRNDFWIFLVVNYVILIIFLITTNGLGELSESDSNIFEYTNIIISIFFIVPIVSAAIRRVNDIKKPKYYLLIPFYNLFLLTQKGTNTNNSNENSIFPLKFVVRVIFGTLLIGIINAVISLLFLSEIDNNASINTGVGVILFALYSIPFSLFLVFLFLLFTNKEINKEKINSTLFYCFIITLSLLFIITYASNQ